MTQTTQSFASVDLQHPIPADLLTVGLDLVPAVRDLGIHLSVIHIDTDASHSFFAVLRQMHSISDQSVV